MIRGRYQPVLKIVSPCCPKFLKVIFFLGLAAASGGAHSLPADVGRNAVHTLTTAHYRFEMAAEEAAGEQSLVRALEALWMFYQRAMGSLVALNGTPERVRILDFSGRQDLHRFLDQHTDVETVFSGLPRSLEGGYVALDSENVLGPSDLASLFHAVVHLLNSRLLYEEGAVGSWWTREGLAVYFMQTPMDRDGRFRYGKVRSSEGFIADITDGNRTAGALVFAEEPKKALKKIKGLFKKHRQVPLARLLQQPADEPWPDAESRNEASVEAWILVHFLMHGRNGGLRSRLGRFLERERGGEGGEAAFRKTISGDLKTFERLMYAYIKKMR